MVPMSMGVAGRFVVWLSDVMCVTLGNVELYDSLSSLYGFENFPSEDIIKMLSHVYI